MMINNKGFILSILEKYWIKFPIYLPHLHSNQSLKSLYSKVALIIESLSSLRRYYPVLDDNTFKRRFIIFLIWLLRRQSRSKLGFLENTKGKDRKILEVSINPFMRASNDSEAIQSKFLENSISVKFSLKTCLCSSLIVVYINKDQILCSASDGEENIQRNFKLKQFHSWFDSLQFHISKKIFFQLFLVHSSTL